MSESNEKNQGDGNKPNWWQKELLSLKRGAVFIFLLLTLVIGLILGFVIQANFLPEISELVTPKDWLTFAQFLVGTVLLGFFASIINNQIQNRKLDIQEMRHLATFKKQITDEKTLKRERIAEYFSYLSPSEESRGRWKNYIEKSINEEENILEQSELIMEEVVEQLKKWKEDGMPSETIDQILGSLDLSLDALRNELEESPIEAEYIDSFKIGDRMCLPYIGGDIILDSASKESAVLDFNGRPNFIPRESATVVRVDRFRKVVRLKFLGYEERSDLKFGHFEIRVSKYN